MELEENKVDFFARKRICIKTKTEDNILEKFKVDSEMWSLRKKVNQSRESRGNNINKRVNNDQSQGADSAAKTVENEHELSGNVADSSIPFPPGVILVFENAFSEALQSMYVNVSYGNLTEVRCEEERLGTVFNVLGANAFNDFILNSNLLDVHLDGFSFTWSHRSASKMSKLDRFLISDGFHSSYIPRHVGESVWTSNCQIIAYNFVTLGIDYGATPFRLFHSCFDWDGFDIMVSSVWSSMSLSDSNGMVRFKKKLQHLKKEIRSWVMERKKQNMGNIYDIKSKLHELDVTINQGGANADILASRLNLMKNLHDKSRKSVGGS
ncbi:hypothetical protein Tco_0024636 [Tanacetum coccineum]